MDVSAEFIAHQLSSENPFRVAVTYTPTGSTAKSIYAVVGYKGSTKISSRAGFGSMYDVEMIISNDTTSGVANVTIGKDIVAFTSPEYGNTTNTYTVAGIIGYTAMGWHLGLRP